VSELNRFQAHDRDTLLATGIDGEVLHPDHGFPARLIAPNRPGVEQTKWVGRLEVV
jgi:DMSO/TMAO reductase YedYZ molybdopterin-dependent catalytic subunit